MATVTREQLQELVDQLKASQEELVPFWGMAGEFSQVENAVWNGSGYSYYHSHVISPYIKEIYDIEVIHSKTMVVGNESKIYSSNDSGYSWGEYVDLTNVDTDPPGSVQIIASNGNDILFGAEKKIVYHSTVIRTEAVPLEEPV